MDISLLERLFERDVYMTYTQTSSGTDKSQYYASPPCTHLIRVCALSPGRRRVTLMTELPFNRSYPHGSSRALLRRRSASFCQRRQVDEVVWTTKSANTYLVPRLRYQRRYNRRRNGTSREYTRVRTLTAVLVQHGRSQACSQYRQVDLGRSCRIAAKGDRSDNPMEGAGVEVAKRATSRRIQWSRRGECRGESLVYALDASSPGCIIPHVKMMTMV